MRTIAIVLGDNDFGNTFRPLLEGLKSVLSYREEGELKPADVEQIIRHSIMAYYVGYQHRFDLSYKDDRLTHTEHYLSGIKVLFDEEAENDISAGDHNGGAWYLELQSGTVCSY